MKNTFQHFTATAFLLLFSLIYSSSVGWGFFAHQKINYHAVFLLPPEMMILYKPNITFISEHATDPDKRRYAVPDEAARHYIDIDHYGTYPFELLPRKWKEAEAGFGKDSLQAYGIVPWHIQRMLYKLTNAFKEKKFSAIMKYSTEIGHYIGDAHVPLHANSNHNGQYTNQKGIHGFWESRIPELLADKEFNLFIGKAEYIKNPEEYIWKRVLESAKASDSVLLFEKELSKEFKDDQKYAFEEKNGTVIRQYSTAFTTAFNNRLNGMVERRMRQSIYSIASFWYTAWVNAGQPDLKDLAQQKLSDTEQQELDHLNEQWNQGTVKGRICE